MKRMIIIIILSVFSLLLLLVLYFFLGSGPTQKNIIWGVNFSQMQAVNLGLDWKDSYSALIDDLGVKYIKLVINWDWVNGKKDEYFFDDVDWQMKEAEKNNIKIIMDIGQKTGRWPECHIPEWVGPLSKEERETQVLKYLEKMVERYKNSSSMIAWQIENEPFFPFGVCPPTDKEFLEREVRLVRSLDETKKPIIISDTGEFSLWIKPAKIGDIVGDTMYKRVWMEKLGTYFYSPFPPLSYWWRAKFIKMVFGKKVECVELQAEPWGPVLLYDLPLAEQKKTMDLEKFKYMISFAKKTGLDTFYLWGSEWWYQMKTQYNDPSIWDEAKKLFQK